MRALLVVNPKATSTNERSRDVLVRALGAEMKLDVAYTMHRGHATELAREAAQARVDLLVTLGGDGTVNEAVNGLMTAREDHRGGGRAGELPALAVVPGGSTNVFARALGLPPTWPEATGAILDALRRGHGRTIGLGRADERYFTFCAGMGLDAAVIHRVEEARQRGRVSTPGLYLRSSVSQFFRDPERRRPSITLERPGEDGQGELSMVIIQNTAPWTFLGNRAINPNPDASFDRGLDVLALRALGVSNTARTVTQMLSRQPDPHGPHVVRLHDVDEFSLLSGHAQHFQVDGDHLGQREKVRFISVPAALRVIC